MKHIFHSETSFAYRIFLLLAILISGLVFTYVIFLSVIFALSGFNITLFNEQLSGFAANVNLLRLMQTIQSFCIFIIPPIILARLYKERVKGFLHLGKPGLMAVLIGMFSIVVMVPLINMLVHWNAGMHLPDFLQNVETWMRNSENSAEKVTQTILQGSAWYDLIISLIIVALLAGIGEEFFFRGLLMSLFSKEIKSRSGKNPDWVMHLTIWLVAFLFSAIHMQFYGFIPRFLLGAWFGYLLWWTGSIWVPVMAHFTNNAFSTIAVFSRNNGLITNDPDQIGLGNTWWLCLISVVLLFICAFILKRGKYTDDIA